MRVSQSRRAHDGNRVQGDDEPAKHLDSRGLLGLPAGSGVGYDAAHAYAQHQHHACSHLYFVSGHHGVPHQVHQEYSGHLQAAPTPMNKFVLKLVIVKRW